MARDKNITKESFARGIKMVFYYLKFLKKEMFFLAIFSVISALGNVFVPYIAGSFFDSLIKPQTLELLNDLIVPAYIALLALWIVIQIITSIIDWRIWIQSNRVGMLVWIDYASRGFNRLIDLPMSFFKSNKIGEIFSKVNMASNGLETIMSRVVVDLIPQFLSIVIAFAIMIKLQPLLAGILFAGVVLYLFIMKSNIAPLANLQKDLFDKMGDSYNNFYGILENVQTVKQAALEEYEKEKSQKEFNGVIFPLWSKMSKIWENLSFYQKAIIITVQTVIFLLSASFIMKGQMTLGELFAINAYSAMVFGPFVSIGRNWQSIQNGFIDINEVEKIANLPHEIHAPKDAVAIDGIKGDIAFKNVIFCYEEGSPVLKNVSFELKPGEVVALIGESGVGKSTITDLVSGLYFPTSGSVLIDGHDIRKINLKFLRSNIGVVPQEVVLFNDTVKNNIKYGRMDASDEEVVNAAKKSHAFDFIDKFTNKFEQLVGERGVKLSVGQKQRIGIARAILRNPKILILDEPTSALDARSEHIIQQSMKELMTGKTTFIVAHRLSTIRKADKILVLKDGAILEMGNHDELMNKAGEYRKLFELQQGLAS